MDLGGDESTAWEGGCEVWGEGDEGERDDEI